MKAVYMVLSILFLAVFWGEGAASVSPAPLPTIVTPAPDGASIRISSTRLTAEEWASLNTSSHTLLRWAWRSLSAGDFNGAAAYSNRVIDLYSARADEMQAALTSAPSGSPDQILQYWALNDVATALFILGESYLGSGREQESTRIFQKIIDQYPSAQTWDPRGWFWSVVSVAQDRLDMAAMMREVGPGDHGADVLLQKAWVEPAQGRVGHNTILPPVGIPSHPWINF